MCHLTLDLLAEARTQGDDEGDDMELEDAGSPGSDVSDREAYAAELLEAALGSMEAPHPYPTHPNNPPHHPQPFHAQRMPPIQTVAQQAMHPQQGPSHAPGTHPLKLRQPIKFVSASASADRYLPHMLPAASNAAAAHQHRPDAAPASAAHLGLGYATLQPFDSNVSTATQYSSSGGDSPLSRTSEVDEAHFQAFLLSEVIPPTSGVNSRERRLAAMEKVPEAVDATEYHSRHAAVAQAPKPVSAAAAFSKHAAAAVARITKGLKSRKRPLIEAEQELEAVSNSRDVQRQTLFPSPTAENKPLAVRFYPMAVRHTSGAAHATAARHHYERQSVQQFQATHLTVDRVATPDRKRRKQRHTASPAASSVPNTAAATAAATMNFMPTATVPASIPAGAGASSQAAAPAMRPPAAQTGYQEGEIVWAKLGGDPWWPATVSQCLLMQSLLLCIVSIAIAPQDRALTPGPGLHDNVLF